MPHAIREHHLDDLCANCKKLHTEKDIELVFQHHKIYEIITCHSCGYKLIRHKDEKQFHNKLEYM